MSRILARDCGFKMVFQHLFNEESMDNLIVEEHQLSEEDKAFSDNVFSCVKDNLDKINEKLTSKLKNNLTVKDIYKLDYAILLVGIASIDYLNEPLALIINECVELAKKYSTEKSPSFVNGVLSSIYK
ncbi:MAG: transcription antitermination factor NusB [Clostridia bacterium]|nr:transcription antitermination factor NusB [Clostridia bacterium]